MRRLFILYLFIIFSVSAFTQTTNNDTIKTFEKESTGLKKAIKKFFDFSNFDTLYISPNRYNYALMTTHFSNFEYYSISSTTPTTQQITFSPNPHNKLGFYFGWRWIFLGWSFNVDDIYRKTSRKNKGTEFDLSLNSSKFGIDLFYRKTGNNYRMYNIKGFSNDIPSDYSENFNGLKANIKGLTLYYITNNKKFSYPAAFSQSTNQRKSVGSMIIGFSASKNNIDFDYKKLPQTIQETMNPGMKVENIKFINIALSCGYAYNWVFARNFLASISLTPAIAYKMSLLTTEENKENESYRNFNLDFIVRCGVVYNNSKYYAGTSFLGKTCDYQRNNFALYSGFGTLQIYAGFNFCLRKAYRTHK